MTTGTRGSQKNGMLYKKTTGITLADESLMMELLCQNIFSIKIHYFIRNSMFVEIIYFNQY